MILNRLKINLEQSVSHIMDQSYRIDFHLKVINITQSKSNVQRGNQFLLRPLKARAQERLVENRLHMNYSRANLVSWKTIR